MLKIVAGGLDDPRVVRMLGIHLTTARSQTAQDAEDSDQRLPAFRYPFFFFLFSFSFFLRSPDERSDIRGRPSSRIFRSGYR
jgi:hypothetical protein